MKTITLKEYSQIPIIYDDDGNFDIRLKMKVGDHYVMREPINAIDIGSVVSVYEIIRLTKTGNESKITMLKIE